MRSDALEISGLVIDGLNESETIGMPLISASKIIGKPSKARVCGSELAWSIAQRDADSGRSLILLDGGHPETVA